MSLLWQTVTGAVTILKKRRQTLSMCVCERLFPSCCPLFFTCTRHILSICLLANTQMYSYHTKSFGTCSVTVGRRLLVAEYFISQYWTHSPCLYFDPADGRWDMVWPLDVTLGKCSNLFPLSLFFLLLWKGRLWAVACKTKYFLSSRNQDSHTSSAFFKVRHIRWLWLFDYDCFYFIVI